MWSLKTASVSTLNIEVANGYDRISRVGDRGFSSTISINGKPVAVDTYTVSEDGHTLTAVGGPNGQPHTIAHERQ